MKNCILLITKRKRNKIIHYIGHRHWTWIFVSLFIVVVSIVVWNCVISMSLKVHVLALCKKWNIFSTLSLSIYNYIQLIEQELVRSTVQIEYLSHFVSSPITAKKSYVELTHLILYPLIKHVLHNNLEYLFHVSNFFISLFDVHF